MRKLIKIITMIIMICSIFSYCLAAYNPKENGEYVGQIINIEDSRGTLIFITRDKNIIRIVHVYSKEDKSINTYAIIPWDTFHIEEDVPFDLIGGHLYNITDKNIKSRYRTFLITKDK